MKIAYLHGFNSSHRSFNFIQAKLQQHDLVPINYDSHQALDGCLAQIKAQLPKGQLALVGHSLGGVLSTLLAAELGDRVDRLVTISSPLGGSKAAAMMKWLPGHPKIMHDITPSSKHIEKIAQLKLPLPCISIISTGGSLPTTPEANDSIVTVASQKALKFGRKIEIKANHFEVLLHEKTVKALADFLFDEEHA